VPLDPGFIRSLDVKLIDRIPAAIDLMQFDCNEQLNWWLRNRARLYHIEKGISLVTCWLAGNGSGRLPVHLRDTHRDG
jgi:hypothetical protein